MNIAFVWQGVTERFNHWNDGLREAMRIIEEKHTVRYYEPWADIKGDVVLYWEAPCTINGGNAQYYNRVRELPIKKVLLFAGGPIEKEWVAGFDMLTIESEVNINECLELKIPHHRAFGINDRIFKPMSVPKLFTGIHHGTCASWKRQGLMGVALNQDALLVGRNQKSDPNPFIEARKAGATIIEEVSYEQVALLINMSEMLVQTSDVWGGGQRATLEAMACNIPVICMSDSPKNREFVEESGFGVVSDPSIHSIRESIDEARKLAGSNLGREYIESKWTAKKYAEDILKTIDLC